MKMKILILFVMMVMLSSNVLAMNDARNNEDNIRSDMWIPRGLENAMLNVEEQPNTNQAMKVLEQNWERFTQRNQERINRCQDNCDFVVSEHKQGFHQVVIQEKTDIKFFGLRLGTGIAKERFVFNEQGEVLKHNENVWRLIQKWRNN